MTTVSQSRPFATRLAAPWRRLGRLALDLALPPLCPVCREPLADPGGLCGACWARLTFVTRPYCERLGIPFPYDPGPGVLSRDAVTDPPSFRRARAAVRFDEVARVLVHAFKYGDRLDLAPLLGRWMATAGADLLAEADALVPVPLHWRRRWTRRFNQSSALAESIAAVRPVAVWHDVLVRAMPTPQQVGLSRAERRSNVQGAFQAAKHGAARIRGRRLVLIDDVLTSGATADACARALLRAGAAHVDVVVLARVVDAAEPAI